MPPARPWRAPAAAYLAARTRLGVKFGLETSRALAAALGRPERAFPSLLVAGTNGKGSVAAYLDAALRASGLRVGRYTSPHLVRVNERIVVDGREVSDRGLARAVLRVRDCAERLRRTREICAAPTYFEVLTVAAFDHFRRAGVDAAVLEVGMGGRLDATNIVEPLASAIVSVERDHQAYLGETLAAIAREKAGVLRPGRAAVLGPMAREAHAEIAAEARRIGARLVDAAAGARFFEAPDGLTLETPQRRYRGLVPLPGLHQRTNLLVAVRLLEEASRAGLAVDFRALPRATASTRWPGRLQWIEGDPPLLLDGAHNPAGARALAAHLAPRRPFVLLFGALADKDIGGIARMLFPLAHAVVLTRAPGERAASPDTIARRAGSLARGARREPRLARALRLARSLAPPGRPVVVAGSLYLVGAVLALLSRPRK